ncbi:hypothetical protein K2X85_19405 [bacterium]|nr:hypothetical protein [bacterium]
MTTHPPTILRARFRSAIARVVWIGLGIAMHGGIWVEPVWAAEVAVLNDDGSTRALVGEIVEETTREVVVKTAAGEEQRIPVYQVDSVKYDQQPPELAAARSFATQGRFDEALPAMMAILDEIDAKKNSGLDAAIRFEVFLIKAKKGLRSPPDLPAAVEWYAQQKELLAGTRHHYPSLEWAGRVQLALGESAIAEELFSALGSVDWPGYRERSQRYLAELALRQGKAEEAARLFGDVVRSSTAGSTAQWERSLASIGQAEALVQSGKAEEAEKICRQILDDPAVADRPAALAPLRNVLGDALAKLDRKKEAVLDGYMWVHVLYSAEETEHARALFHLASLLGDIGYPQYAEQMAQILTTKLGQTEWAKKLQVPSP